MGKILGNSINRGHFYKYYMLSLSLSLTRLLKNQEETIKVNQK